MYLKRHYKNLSTWMWKGKVLLIYGARRTGKTSLLKKYLETCKHTYNLETGENVRLQQLLNSGDIKKLKEYAYSTDLLVIDEAQEIPNIGKGLKILIDIRPELKIIASGSSSFELNQQIGEPLTGRKRDLKLYPLSWFELQHSISKYDLRQGLNEHIIYGLYPEVLTAKTNTEKEEILRELVNSYLLKDILSFDRIKSSQKLLELLQLLAFQVGSEVSHHELGKQLSMNSRTIERYLDLLEKCFVIHKLSAFSKNTRKEITKKNKYYFYDNGILNGIISNFNFPPLRNDIGGLWENFLINERMKALHYKRVFPKRHFWRSYAGQELDYIEIHNGEMFTWEFKWKLPKTTSMVEEPSGFASYYSDYNYSLINRENFMEFVLLEDFIDEP
ncbi:MAG: ATP-binding protein [Bacteroidota bacterium]|nr:ATP-binding protein [Bacteroidota bacterium]